MHIDVSTLQFLVDTAIPFLVAFLVRRFASERVKSGVMAVAAFLVALIQEGIDNGGSFSIPDLIGRFATALATAFIAHQFVWKPVGLTGDNGVILKAVPGGVGKVDVATLGAHNSRKYAA